MTPLQALFLRPGLPSLALPEALARLYGSDLGFRRPAVIANFVASVDGVVALPGPAESGQIVSGNSEADRFVMALLRACADAVLIGAGTFRKGGGDLWHAAAVDPERAPLHAAWRRQLGLGLAPPLVLATASGDIDPAQPALEDAIVVTTRHGAARLAGRLPGGARLLVPDSDPIRLGEVIDRLRDDGLGLLLSEGGPSLVAQLVAEHRLDELLLTRSPALLGRFDGDGRKPLLAGADFPRADLELASAHLHGSHLFLRYQVARPPAP